MFYIGCFFSSVYLLVIKFPVASESIIVFLFFLLILIPIYSWAVLIEAASLLAGAILQYFFWLLLLEEFSSFFVSSEDVSDDCSISYLGGILYIFYIYSESHNCPLYRIVTVFVCNLWLVLFIVSIFADSWFWSKAF